MQDIIFGQIIDHTPDSVEIICRLSDLDKPAYLQVRRFSIDLLKGVVDIKVNNFIKITITLIPGKQTTEVEQVFEDISHYFIKEDIFKDLGDSPFFTKAKKI